MNYQRVFFDNSVYNHSLKLNVFDIGITKRSKKNLLVVNQLIKLITNLLFIQTPT